MSQNQLKDIIKVLDELKEDLTIPKNIKTKIDETICALKEECDNSIKINKALDILDEISEDANIQPYTRSQLWNIVSMLERI